MSLKLILLILVAEIFICSAQFLFKTGANKLKAHNLNTVQGYIAFIKSSLVLPAVWGGLLLNAFAVVVWILVLALVDLSLAIPLDSIHYVVILLGSHFFLKERMTWDRIAATLFIAGGIALVALG
jgi:drug/metabolite transporter (DMT)-like permease